MTMLLLGNPNSVWVKNFIENCVRPLGISVYMVYPEELRDEFKNFYKKSEVHFIKLPNNNKMFMKNKRKKNKIVSLFAFMSYFISLKKISCVNIINVQYVSTWELAVGSLLKRKENKFIASYWGSDLMRESRKELKCKEKFLRKCDMITLESKDLQNVFRKEYGDCYDEKCHIAMFGLPILDEIKKISEVVDKKTAKKEIGIEPDSITIAIGYNARKEQQHLSVLKELQKLDSEVGQRITILLQMTYGGTADYRNEVRAIASQLGCKVMVYERFLTDRETAVLRIATDVYINAQTTDAFSGSVCENLYAGCTLINAAWLRYEELKEGFQYIEFSGFDELSQIVTDVCENKYFIDQKKNQQIVWKMRSWTECIQKWTEVLLQ